ncbi:MAG TPA: hypothetical protein VFT75_18575 [Nocardioidaceae bacterium]|nr:hypothetical protein [Nocardioidaceae bacterium]
MSNILTLTELADNEARVERRTRGTRANLAEAALAGADAETLARLANEVAEADGAHLAYQLVTDVWDTAERLGNDPEHAITRQLTRRLLTGAEDSWSGRGNDAKRAMHDGFRAAAERILGF